MRRNEVAVSVTFDDVAHGFGGLLQHLLVTKGCVCITTYLLRPLFRLCHDCACIAYGLVEASVCLFVNIFDLLDGLRTLVGCCCAGLFQQGLRLSSHCGHLVQCVGELALRFSFSVSEVFVFTKRFKVLDGSCNKGLSSLL